MQKLLGLTAVLVSSCGVGRLYRFASNVRPLTRSDGSVRRRARSQLASARMTIATVSLAA
jgi:hypothetical protein